MPDESWTFQDGTIAWHLRRLPRLKKRLVAAVRSVRQLLTITNVPTMCLHQSRWLPGAGCQLQNGHAQRHRNGTFTWDYTDAKPEADPVFDGTDYIDPPELEEIQCCACKKTAVALELAGLGRGWLGKIPNGWFIVCAYDELLFACSEACVLRHEGNL